MHKPTYHPTLASRTWTKASTAISGFPACFYKLTLVSEPVTASFATSNNYRFEFRASGASAPTLATDGLPLPAGWVHYESNPDQEVNVDLWLYNESLTPAATLAIHVEA